MINTGLKISSDYKRPASGDKILGTSSGSAHRTWVQWGDQAAHQAGSRTRLTMCQGLKGSWRTVEVWHCETQKSHWWRCSLCCNENARTEGAMKRNWGLAMSEARRGHWWRYTSTAEEIPVSWRCQDHEVTTKNTSRCRVELASAYKTSCVCYRCQSPEDHEWAPDARQGAAELGGTMQDLGWIKHDVFLCLGSSLLE